LLLACAAISSAVAQEPDAASQIPEPTPISTPIVYRNTQYGFCFRLPANWKGYKIITEKWGTETDSYPVLTIRNPKWTEDDPWQDIPIMIFTRAQWGDEKNDDENLNTTGYGPTEIGRSKTHVFAQPARWIGFDDLKGTDEVQSLMMQDPFQASCGPPIIYHNTQYDFCFRLPAGWRGYKIVTDKWSGGMINKEAPGTPRIVSGPEILIRNPAWSEEEPYQDIPIMVFTRALWREANQDGIILSAAGIGPSDIGRNAKYVFVQPPRWVGYAEITGWREVEDLMATHPFQAPCAASHSAPPKKP
jgi:hypothetical protein